MKADTLKLSVAVTVLSVVSLGHFSAAQAQPSPSLGDVKIHAEVAKSLNKSSFKGVAATVRNGAVNLSGGVKLYADKADAERRVHRIKDVVAVRDDIAVGLGETTVSDQELQKKLVKKVAYDRVGYGTTAFDAITVNVDNGIVTLGGHAYGPADKNSALSDAAYMAGVKGVINKIQVDPVSFMDDRIRIAVFQCFALFTAFPL